MRQWTKSSQLWLCSAGILALLLLASPRAAAFDFGNDRHDRDSDRRHDRVSDHKRSIPTPEPGTLMLLALGGGAMVLGARFRKGRRQ